MSVTLSKVILFQVKAAPASDAAAPAAVAVVASGAQAAPAAVAETPAPAEEKKA